MPYSVSLTDCHSVEKTANMSGMTPRPPKAAERKRIGELLVAEGFVEPHQVAEALRIQKQKGGKTVEILISLGFLSVGRFASFVSKHQGIPSLELANYRIDSEITSLIPRDFVVKHEIFPIDKLGKLLTVGMVCPLDTDTLEMLERTTKLRVKPVLCSAADLRKAIDMYYPNNHAKKTEAKRQFDGDELESSMKIQIVGKLLRDIEGLPTLPTTVQKVQEAAQNDSVALKDVAVVVEKDPAIAAKLLHLANSAAYGFPNKVDSIQMATTLLGLKETYLVVLSSAVVNMIEKADGFNYQKFWNDAMFCAIAAKQIADACGERRRPGVFTAGLLHDIGRFALHEVAPGWYKRVNPGLTGTELVDEENRVMGIAHPEAGFTLAERWGLPKEICEAVRFHHCPENADDSKDLAAMIAAAAGLTEARSNPLPDGGLPEVVVTRFAALGIDADEASRIRLLAENAQKSGASKDASRTHF
ncbi:MAG: HDOD domain-containing protein [Candidatus Hydrogenedentota bacterium]